MSDAINLNALRRMTGLSHKDLATLFGTSRDEVCRWLEGAEMPRLAVEHMLLVRQVIARADLGSPGAVHRALRATGNEVLMMLKRRDYGDAAQALGSRLAGPAVPSATPPTPRPLYEPDRIKHLGPLPQGLERLPKHVEPPARGEPSGPRPRRRHGLMNAMLLSMALSLMAPTRGDEE